jgi:flavin reductase (DIM6/NTAB) family NADH-FMN oxidoreductase RutF
MLSFDPKELTITKIQQLLTGGITPRPIAFVSTISSDGINNLAPFSFFNAFGANPPVVAFSAARRGTNNTTKDTYHNLMETKECVIHTVSHAIVEQMNLASCEFGPEIDEFEKAGFTAIDSDLVKPKRVLESPFQMECKLWQMVEVGGNAGSANIAICEVVKFHVSESIMQDDLIDANLLDAVGRNGGDWYTRASNQALFSIRKPGKIKAIGIGRLPNYIIESDIFTGNNLAQFALIDDIPSMEEANLYVNSIDSLDLDINSFDRYERVGNYEKMLAVAKFLHSQNHKNSDLLIQRVAKCALSKNKTEIAWYCMLHYFG